MNVLERIINRLIYRYNSNLHSINHKLDLLLFSKNKVSNSNYKQDELFDEIYVSLLNDKKVIISRINELSTMRTYIEEGNTVGIEDVLDYIE